MRLAYPNGDKVDTAVSVPDMTPADDLRERVARALDPHGMSGEYVTAHPVDVTEFLQRCRLLRVVVTTAEG